MCGRFTLTSKPTQFLQAHFGIAGNYQYHQSYNIAPSQIITVTGAAGGDDFYVTSMSWGYIPGWLNASSSRKAMINARLETIAEKPYYKQSFSKKRCLILADGYFEWLILGDGRKQPFYIQQEGHAIFAMAGIWDTYIERGESVKGCAIITKDAGESVAKIHNRMPVIIAPEDYSDWLDPDLQDSAVLSTLLEVTKAPALHYHAVTTRVGNPKYNKPDCIAQVDV